MASKTDDWTGYHQDDADDYEDVPADRWSKRNRIRRGPKARRRAREQRQATRPKRSSVESRDGTFRCRQCKTIVGPPLSGGRHRNHCPLCLFSRHVDRSRPGDRESDCRSMMQPVGVHVRLSGEQALVHECLGCGVVRRNRVAADDVFSEVMRLPVMEPDRAERVKERSVS